MSADNNKNNNNSQKNSDRMDYRMNKPSKSHNHHNKPKSQHKAPQQEATSTTGGESTTQKLSPNSSINSYSSSSISSESSNSSSNSSSPPPPQSQQSLIPTTSNQQQQQQVIGTPSESHQPSKIQSKHEKLLKNYENFNNTFKPNPKPLEHNYQQQQRNRSSVHLQSILVPKLQHVHPFKMNADDFSLLNLSHININANKSSDNIHSHMSNKFNSNQQKVHFLGTNQSTPNVNSPALSSNSASASSEVKLKLKNSILQKQLIAKSNSNINQMSNNGHNSHQNGNNHINVTRSQSYLMDSQNQFKQSMQSMLQHSHLTNINENNVYHQQQQQGAQYFPLKDRNHYQAQPEPNPAPKQPNLSSKHIELLNQLDENNLRRTTSEPNLKVKSALKDRLLEKRNLLNPFPAKRPAKQSMQSPTAIPLPVPLHKAQKSTAFMPQQQQPTSVSMSASNLLGSNKLHHQQQQYNEQLLGALAHAVGQSTPELMSLQKQQLAASALLSLSNSQNEMSNEQKAYNVHVTLRQLQQQQQQQSSVNLNVS